MAQFDVTLWKTRAWDRFSRALRRGVDKRVIEPQWAIDVMAIGDLERIIDWCTSKGICVTFAKKVGGTYDPESKNVVLASRLSPARQVAFLLHECGHHLIGRKEHHERFGMGYPQTDPEIKKTFQHRVAVLEEELEAWHRGWKLAERLDLSLGRETFDDIRLECLKSYIKWSLRRASQ